MAAKDKDMADRHTDRLQPPVNEPPLSLPASLFALRIGDYERLSDDSIHSWATE